jgi:ribulose-5-phosphate 4-epimerase/fuculose-1-phosphate aldolase
MTDAGARLEVAQASRILFGLGIVDAFGHASRRHPDNPQQFLMSRSMAPGLVTPDDVIAHELDGDAVPPATGPVFLERFIHAAIYRARPEVGGIVHSHAPSVIPFTVVDQPVRPLAHTCGFLSGTGPAFDVAEIAGDGTDLLIRDPALGKAFADHLGHAHIALMRGHGFTAVGSDIVQAVFRAAYTASNCQLQMAAMRLGTPRYLTEAEAAACDAATSGQVPRAWNLWLTQHVNF